ncbi:MAG: sigma-54-dependent Fis family transcriptional regulator, partial [Candidatus Schekmanbacteria bacterium]|nr:sigma-54-dependent Fis family transcriptional regulator [Candidatus Schekmanbacteria bacterium]
QEKSRLQDENAALRRKLGNDPPIGDSQAMRRALDLARRIAPSDVTVAILGETGTGKEILARHIHQLSPRHEGPFVVVDCGAIPEGLIESELFGHEKGAFTGASGARKGRFREAEGGTVLLDEIGELSTHMQTRLLRALQERTVQPVGGTGRVPVDVRILCATHRDLDEMVESGRLRRDLYYRIAIIALAIPPLREREADIMLLARHFLRLYSGGSGRELAGFVPDAVQAMAAHDWPGNVRELEHRVQRAVILAEPPWVTLRDLGLEPPGGAAAAEQSTPSGWSAGRAYRDARTAALERFERDFVAAALRHYGGNVSKAAAATGVSRQYFQRLMSHHGVGSFAFRPRRSAGDRGGEEREESGTDGTDRPGGVR